jgi:hypothetical protein
LPRGLGFFFELAETLMAEYRWTWEYTVRVPLVRQLALWAAMRKRKGEELGGMDYRTEEFAEYMSEGANGPEV